MNAKQMLKDYEKFATELYMEIKSQFRYFGGLKRGISRIVGDLAWEHGGGGLAKKMEDLLQKDIDSVLEILPIPKQDHTCEDVIVPNEERKKFGLSPVPGGDVAITSETSGADASTSGKVTGKSMRRLGIAHSVAKQVEKEGITYFEAIAILNEAITIIQRNRDMQMVVVSQEITDRWGTVITEPVAPKSDL